MEKQERRREAWIEIWLEYVTLGFPLRVVLGTPPYQLPETLWLCPHSLPLGCVWLGTIHRSNFCLLWTVNQQQLQVMTFYLTELGDEEETVNPSLHWTADTVGARFLQFYLWWIKPLCFGTYSLTNCMDEWQLRLRASDFPHSSSSLSVNFNFQKSHFPSLESGTLCECNEMSSQRKWFWWQNMNNIKEMQRGQAQNA